MAIRPMCFSLCFELQGHYTSLHAFYFFVLSLQTVSLWDWTTDGETPICSTELKESYGIQSYVHFNPEDTTQIVSNSESQVVFYSWVSHTLID